MTRRSDSEGDLPLIRWAEQLRRDRDARRKLRNRAILLNIGSWSLIATIVLPPAPRLVWNASASAPVGLYSVAPGGHVHKGDYVIAELPQATRNLAARRHYLPVGVPLVKRIAAIPGDTICATGNHILINGSSLAVRQTHDASSRPMPWWSGCHILHDGQYFLLMASIPTSFDGRYFGISDAQDIVGRAHLLWAR